MGTQHEIKSVKIELEHLLVCLFPSLVNEHGASEGGWLPPNTVRRVDHVNNILSLFASTRTSNSISTRIHICRSDGEFLAPHVVRSKGRRNFGGWVSLQVSQSCIYRSRVVALELKCLRHHR